MTFRNASLLGLALVVFGPGCTITDSVPCMCTPPYRDPPRGFSSSYYRYLYGRNSRAAELAKKDEAEQKAASDDASGETQLLGHETTGDASPSDAPAGRRPPFDMSFLQKRPEPIRF